MRTPLDVLVVESHPRAAEHAVATLEAAGHRVHRCHEADSRGFPCVGVSHEGGCPMERPIDVAFLARRQVSPRPTALEDGMSCVIRAGIPIVEDGPDAFDPYAEWVTHRLAPGEDVAAVCETLAASTPLHDTIRSRIGTLLRTVGVDPADVGCHLEHDDKALVVNLDVPVAVDRSMEHALAVRVLDAMTTSKRTFGQVDVRVHHPGNARP
jgi:hypothetical protein